MFVQGSEETLDDAIVKEETERKEAGAKTSEFSRAVTLVFCFVGLQVEQQDGC